MFCSAIIKYCRVDRWWISVFTWTWQAKTTWTHKYEISLMQSPLIAYATLLGVWNYKYYNKFQNEKLFWHLWRMSWESSHLNKQIHWLLQKQQTTCALPLVSFFLPHDHYFSCLWWPRMCAKNLKAHYCPILTKNSKLAYVEHSLKTWINLYIWKMKGL